MSKSLARQAILCATLALGSAPNHHVLRVRSGFSALSVSRLAATIYVWWDGAKLFAFRVRRDDFYRPVPAVRGIVCR
ncbi:hypothetical protein CPZ26_024150 [Raoultella ornithinolytica]|nr:hypothetical protein CU101_17855 [Raoultella ornithinolytica]PJO25585.1 hypothetical protein CPZ26_024150 [Raoultella ornithinolytica]